MILDHDPIMHHSANVTAVIVPLGAWIGAWVGVLQPVAAFLLTVLGIAYYVRLFYKDWKAGHS